MASKKRSGIKGQAAKKSARRKRSVQSSSVEATAFHEAGHAVMAWRFRNMIRDRGIVVDLSRTEVIAGNTDVCSYHLQGAETMRQIGGPLWERWRRDADWEIQELLAGPLAEHKYLNGGRSPRGTLAATCDINELPENRDWRRIHYYLRLLCENYERHHGELYLYLAQQTVNRILGRRRTWGAVCELAARLIQRGYVSAEDAESLFEARKVHRISKAEWIGSFLS